MTHAQPFAVPMNSCFASLAVAALSLLCAACGGGGSDGGGSSGGSTTSVAPVADFTATPTTVQIGGAVQFTDASTGALNWEWDFNGDGTPESTLQNPTYNFPTVGVFDVTLQVSNSAGSHFRTRIAYVTVTPLPPVASFTATPTTVAAGSAVQFTDASNGAASFAWDFDNNSTVDSTLQNPSYLYPVAGVYTVVLTVSNSAGSDVMTRTGYITVNPAGGTVDLDVDTDRNGVIDNTADEAGEEAWSATRGAVYYWNIDDDDNNAQFDHADAAVNGASDTNDLARIWIRQMATAPAGGTVNISVTPGSAQSNIRVFQNNGAGWSSVYSAGGSFSLPIADLIAGDIELAIEARTRISAGWDGVVYLTLDVLDAASASLGNDQVRLRYAPPLLVTNLWKADRYYIVSITSGTSNNTAARATIQALCNANGIIYSEVPGASYSNDRWLQDSSEPTCVLLPGISGPRRIDSVLQLARNRPCDAWCQNILWDPDFDFIQRFGTSSTSHNYGGNLEVMPPHNNGTTNFPWGRVVIGGGTTTLIGTSTNTSDAMDLVYKQFFDACSVQGPHLEILTSWLAVGHVDEVLAFVPAPNKPRGWAIALASPTLGRQLLLDVQTAGGGALPVFAGRSGWATTVSAALANTALTSFNAGAQVKIDFLKQQLITNCGLTNADFIDVPVMFENAGSNYAAAYNPGVANLVSLPLANGTTVLVVPDPEGPDQPTDVWANATRNALEALGTGANPIQVTFVDVFFSYHDLLGEIHCGTNNVRTPPAGNWWD